MSNRLKIAYLESSCQQLSIDICMGRIGGGVVCGGFEFFGPPPGVFFWKACILFGVAPPAPPPLTPPPFLVPPPGQKGYQSAPSSNRHPSASSSKPETEVLQIYGAKTEIRTPMYTWPTRHPKLACTVPHCFHFFRIPLTISWWHNPVSWGKLLLHWLYSPSGLHPSACASDFWTCPQTPPSTQIAQKGCQSTGLELRAPMIYLRICRSDRVNFWRGGQEGAGSITFGRHVQIPIKATYSESSRWELLIGICMGPMGPIRGGGGRGGSEFLGLTLQNFSGTLLQIFKYISKIPSPQAQSAHFLSNLLG